MKTKITLGVIAAITILVLTLTAFTAVSSVSAANVDRRGNPGRQGGFDRSGQPSNATTLTPLTAAEQKALQDAILEEYGALNLYQAVITQFGNIAPFSQIVRSEEQHVNALITQAQKYGVTVPANPGLATVPTFTTLADACKAGASAEIADARLYDTLKPSVTHTDILGVFDRLQKASLNSHLPAFQSCN